MHRLTAPLLIVALSAAGLIGCAAERPILESNKPTWTHRDGDTQLSNNDLWEQMIPSTATADAGASIEPQFASVEEPVR